MSESIYSDSFNRPCFTLSNRLRRALWNLTYCLLFRLTPNALHPWRAFLLRAFGAKIGKNVHVYPKARIWAPWNLVMGDNSCLADGVECSSMDLIHIGEYSIISQDSRIITGTHDYNDPRHPLITAPVIIGSRVWVTRNVFIHPGIKIGTGAVVGACSVVNKNIAAWNVAAGNPARTIKIRTPFNHED